MGNLMNSHLNGFNLMNSFLIIVSANKFLIPRPHMNKPASIDVFYFFQTMLIVGGSMSVIRTLMVLVIWKHPFLLDLVNACKCLVGHIISCYLGLVYVFWFSKLSVSLWFLCLQGSFVLRLLMPQRLLSSLRSCALVVASVSRYVILL